MTLHILVWQICIYASVGRIQDSTVYYIRRHDDDDDGDDDGGDGDDVGDDDDDDDDVKNASILVGSSIKVHARHF